MKAKVKFYDSSMLLKRTESIEGARLIDVCDEVRQKMGELGCSQASYALGENTVTLYS